MSGDAAEEKRLFYLDTTDEVFAEMFLSFGGAFSVRMEISPETSVVKAVFSPLAGNMSCGEAADFELSACEREGARGADPEEYLGTSVYAACAFGFFDHVFSRVGKLSCEVDFAEGGWIIAVTGCG